MVWSYISYLTHHHLSFHTLCSSPVFDAASDRSRILSIMILWADLTLSALPVMRQILSEVPVLHKSLHCYTYITHIFTLLYLNYVNFYTVIIIIIIII